MDSREVDAQIHPKTQSESTKTVFQQPTTNLSKHDVINLANTLIKLKKYILDFELSFSVEFKDFFYSLVALSSNCIITNISASE